MKDSTKRMLTLEGDIFASLVIGIAALAADSAWILTGTLTVYAHLGAYFLKIKKEEKRGKLLTSADIARLKQLVADARKELNKLMRRPEVALDDTWYEWCNRMHEALTKFHERLNSKDASKLRVGDVSEIEDSLRHITNTLNAARKSKGK